ncbi:hypothetical protein Tsubulata_004412 [Turnera subulata]|uniref:Uncharacterized protein n=1 Tax=Turnera subulata TaxID=218843 RepID=A0A9Q0FEY8_9ROSI|nr:hypothetical protein Tsubulata_004412 [Turnera subulata]
MGSNREEHPLSYPNNPSSSSSPITVSDHLDPSFLPPDPSSSLLGSASNSFQNDAGFLNDSSASSSSDAEFGFSRPEFRQSQLAGTVQFYERHVFLCYKNPSVWPPRIEAAEFDRLPRLLSAAVLARKADMRRETRLTICEGHDGTETSNGDVLIFPDMVRYRRLTHFDVDTFVEEVLVKNGEWLPGTPEKLKGSFVFVCSHGSRDRRCGVCGPPLVSKFKEEIALHGLQSKVSISPCSHIGGHKYAGNVIIFGSSISGAVTGHWYGYVTQDDVPLLLKQHIGKGEIVDSLWRGQMGLSEDEQVKALEQRRQVYGDDLRKNTNGLTQGQIDETFATACMTAADNKSCCQPNGSSCQQNGSSFCCQQHVLTENDNIDANERATKVMPEKKKSGKKLLSRINSGKGSSARRVCAMPTWFESWEREDTYAVLAVICAAVSVGIAYKCYKNSSS